ncbi:MAG: pilus assembly protein PilM [Patescibacteria group bacterium]|jgi:type IV pilus assembly protein PilM|nr:pilus assembly protein PilM [Patescibacteria group bacterium]MDD5172706.1 pilus assembly protein PilM [Patescibacteria group bacterium]
MKLKSVLGLNISDQKIEILSLSSWSKIKNFGEIILEQDIVKGGFILNKEKLIKKLEELISKTKIESKQAIVSLPDSKIFVHVFQVEKNLKGKKLREKIITEATKIFSLKPENVYWSYQITSIDSKMKEVLYTAVFKNIIDDYLEVLSEIKLKPVVFEPESLALGRILLEDSQNAVIINLTERTTNISIFYQQKLKRSLTKLTGENNFIQDISDELKISSSEAKDLEKIGWKEKQIAVILEKGLEELIREIKNILDYNFDLIEEIILTGRFSSIFGLDSYLSSVFKKNVVFKNSINKKLKLENDSSYHVVIGLATRGLNKKTNKEINLLPDKIKIKNLINKPKRNKIQVLRYAFLFLFLIFGAGLIINYVISLKQTPKNTEKIIPLEKQLTLNEAETEKEIAGETEEIAGETEEIKEPKENEIKKEKIDETDEPIISQISVKEDVDVLNVRSGPGTNYAIVTKIHAEEIYSLLEENENWCKIKINDQAEGWVFADYIIKK